ncbi:ABC transporter permease [Arsenicibacter rosenii]|uniref:Cell division protein FtsX n=1 Tax=Arsenicibacter rosenii TaxID=1750698 RepID=A0A1S2VC13_9BACT|nr:ABC transporter permease [Arsenicibacter rosenii]OIN56297.1 cell division protein FtsX [Arsenicibacter rosenii]
MFLNYIKIAWRNLIRNRTFSAINIVGLAIGLATCLLISLYVLDELSYDRFHAKADRIVRVIFRGSSAGGRINESTVMPPVAQTLHRDYPEVLEATRLRDAGSPLISYGNKTFKESSIAFVDSNFTQVFTLPFVEGDPKTALTQPNTAVISESMARKYFGNASPMGNMLTLKSWNTTVKITGVMKDIPANSHFHKDMLMAMAGNQEAKSPSWMMSEYYTYLVLPDGYDYKQLEAKLPQVIGKYIGPQLQQGMGMSLAEFRRKGNDIGLYLQPLTDIHLHSDFAFDLSPPGNKQYVYLFSVIALFILVIACINFMNLSTAGSSRRAREVGIRKVLGSVRQSLASQFLIESMLLTAFALVLAYGLVLMALPAFNEFTGKTLSINLLARPWILPALLVFGLFVGLLAGSYPAFFLSAFKPVSVLKGGTFKAVPNRLSLRSGLVVFQFFIAVTLIAGTLVVYRQLSYIQHKTLGYTKEQVLVLPETWLLGDKEAAFREQILQDRRIISASVSGYVPAGPSNNNNFFVAPESNTAQLVKTLRYDVDYDYLSVLGMKLAAGRNFSKAYGTDSSGVILNETAAKTFGWPTNALGRHITHTDNDGTRRTFTVIGVVKDFHFKSLHEAISPLVMVLGKNTGTIILKVNPADISGLLTSLQKQWQQFMPDAPFTYSFLDERFANTYRAEQNTGLILGLFSGLTIFIACLGLFGLAMFTAEQRQKEIGVRKVLGASVMSVAALLSADFLKLVGIALVLAIPVAWYAMSVWLQDFAYRIELDWWLFALSGIVAIIIALVTVSFQSIKAALVNPIRSLKSE